MGSSRYKCNNCGKLAPWVIADVEGGSSSSSETSPSPAGSVADASPARSVPEIPESPAAEVPESPARSVAGSGSFRSIAGSSADSVASVPLEDDEGDDSETGPESIGELCSGDSAIVDLDSKEDKSVT